jgi:hypothetical protein
MGIKKSAGTRDGPPTEPPAAPEGTTVEIVKSQENWSVYELEDGAVLRLRPVLVDVKRAEGQVGPEGEPVYHLKSTIIIDVRPKRK